MSDPQPIPTNRMQALSDLEEANTYFLACFKRDPDGTNTFCGYVSAESSTTRRELWGMVQQWLVNDQVKSALDQGWLED